MAYLMVGFMRGRGGGGAEQERQGLPLVMLHEEARAARGTGCRLLHFMSLNIHCRLQRQHCGYSFVCM
jgi:hypothetical protein